MKVSFLIPEIKYTENWVSELRKIGIDVLVNNCDGDCDFIIGMSDSQILNIDKYHKIFPDIPMINYDWDIYEWVWLDPIRKVFYENFGKLLKESLEVWCPSDCTIKRLEEWFGLKNGFVIKAPVSFFDVETSDQRYVLNPLREVPDKNLGWFEKACGELDIPFLETKHKINNFDVYKKIVAECSFIVCPYYEASTGGLTLVEGYRIGKPVLISDSKYCGARDYFADRAVYFKADDFEDFKRRIKDMWDNPIQLDTNVCKQHTEQFSVKNFAENIKNRLEVLKNDTNRI